MRFFVKNIFICLLAFLPVYCLSLPQKGGVNQKKIERERNRKGKAAKKQYDQAVIQHQLKQSKETRARMKQTKKESKKATPISH